MKLNRFFVISMCLLLVACGAEEKPQDLIEEEVYINLLVELQIIKSQSYIEPGLETDSLRLEVLNYYGISKEVFLRSHEYYQTEGRAQVQRIEKAIERVSELEGRVLEPQEPEEE